MSEYVIGLGISFEICKLYEELVYLTICNKEHSEEFELTVNKIAILVEEETFIYDNLHESKIKQYYEALQKEDIATFDAEKSRYALKISERQTISENYSHKNYPFSLNTAILGKILLDSLVKLENTLIDTIENEENDCLYDLYSYHKTYKYSLIEGNDFLERLALDFNFDLTTIPKITFEKIKNNFNYTKGFENYLNKVLLVIAKENIMSLADISNKDLHCVYSRMLAMTQLEIVFSYLDSETLENLDKFCIEQLNQKDYNKYIKSLINKKTLKH